MNNPELSLQEQAQAFFNRYGNEFDEANWPAFSSNYCEPAFSVRADGSIAVLSNTGAVAEFFSRVWSAWRQEGYSRFAISGLTAVQVGGQSTLVTFTWHLLREDNTQIRQWNQSYQLLRTEAGWKVLSSTFHSAAA